MDTTRRIRRQDKLNWVTEEFRPSYVATRGKRKGTVVEDGWIIRGYHPTLENAAMSLLDDYLGDGWTGRDLAAEIARAKQAVLKAIKD